MLGTKLETILVTVTLLAATGISTAFGTSILSLVGPAPTTPAPLPFLPLLLKSHQPTTIHLETFPNYAAVLPITEGRPWAKSEEILEILGRDEFQETAPFTVTAPNGFGIMVVIQELQIPASNTFNRSLLVIDENGKIVKCFSKFQFQIEGKSPVDVCGRAKDDDEYMPSVLDGVGPRSFIVPEGKPITIRFIYRDRAIDGSEILKKQVPYYDEGYLFRASIAFTAYRTCPHGPPFDDENGNKLWPCHIPQNERQPVSACVQEQVFCDNVINCGIHDSEEFALDEKFCMSRAANTSIHSSQRQNHALDTFRMEEAIRSRLIRKRPYGYNDMIIQMGAHTPSKNNHFGEPVENPSTVSHPAFVALVVLISIICVLMIGLFFRYCCTSCVGKMDPYGDSSNPEAVARFHERPPGSPGAYGLSHDNLFKPADDLPPPYDDLFPVDERPNNKVFCDNTATSSSNSNNIGEIVITTRTGISDYAATATAPIFTIPVHPTGTGMPSGSNGSPSTGIINEGAYINPAFVLIDAPDAIDASRVNISNRNNIPMYETNYRLNQ